jgi:hypothetical protein
MAAPVTCPSRIKPPSADAAAVDGQRRPQGRGNNDSHFCFYLLGGVALVGSAGLALKRSFWELTHVTP